MITPRTWLLSVGASAVSLIFGCSPTQPVAKSTPTQPVVESSPATEPSDNDPVQDLQQMLASVLVPTFDFREVEGFERGEIHRFEDPSAGYSFPYDSIIPKITVTVYVYNRGLSNIPDGIASSRIKDEVDEVEQSLPEMVRRGYYTSYTRRADGERTIGGQKTLWRSFELGHADGPLTSEVYVTAARSSFIKIRCTYSAECGEACEKKVTNLIARLGEVVQEGRVTE